MFKHLTSLASVEAARAQIAALIRLHPEWFCTAGRDQTHALRREEIDVSVAHRRLVLSCWTEKGTRSWRIVAWEWNGQMMLLQASRRFGAELPLIELTPRASASAVAATIG